MTKNIKGAGAVICDDHGRIVLVLGNEAMKWSFPKGKKEEIDFDYSHPDNKYRCWMRNNAVREVRQETGLDIEIPDETPFKVVNNYVYFFCTQKNVVGDIVLVPQDTREVAKASLMKFEDIRKLYNVNAGIRGFNFKNYFEAIGYD